MIGAWPLTPRASDTGPLATKPTMAAHHDHEVLRQARGAGPEHLADQQLAGRGGGDEQLHDAARLLLGDALGDPVAVGQDRHEGQDDDGIGEDEGAAEVLLVAGVVRVERRSR